MAAPKKRSTKVRPAASAKRAKAPRKAPPKASSKVARKLPLKRAAPTTKRVAKVRKPVKALPVAQPLPELPAPPAKVPPFVPPILWEGDEPLIPPVALESVAEAAVLEPAIPSEPLSAKPEPAAHPPAPAAIAPAVEIVPTSPATEPAHAPLLITEPAPIPEPPAPMAAIATEAGANTGRPVPTPESLWDWHAPAPALTPFTPAMPASRLTLTARDPRSLLADWWLSEADAMTVRSQSADHHLVLRVFVSETALRLVAQIHLPSEWRSHPVDVSRAGASYMAELGLFDAAGNWFSLATADAVTTPAEKAPERYQESVQVSVGQGSQAESVRIPHPPCEPPPGPDYHTVAPAPKTPGPVSGAEAGAGEISVPPEALDRLLMWLESEMGPLKAGLSSGAWQQQHVQPVRSAPPGPGADEKLGSEAGPSGISSHEFKEAPVKPRSFWFKVQADLVVHGATEPDARVVVGGTPVALRPDGTFTLRFALPDGKFALVAEATSADQRETRSARLQFERRTEYSGGTQEAPGDPLLAPPPTA